MLDIDNVDLTDSKTFALYQKGSTLGTFQFESPGMQKHLRALKPDKFADLIAMNALYRPGPLEYILEDINHHVYILELLGPSLPTISLDPISAFLPFH